MNCIKKKKIISVTFKQISKNNFSKDIDKIIHEFEKTELSYW